MEEMKVMELKWLLKTIEEFLQENAETKAEQIVDQWLTGNHKLNLSAKKLIEDVCCNHPELFTDERQQQIPDSIFDVRDYLSTDSEDSSVFIRPNYRCYQTNECGEGSSIG